MLIINIFGLRVQLILEASGTFLRFVGDFMDEKDNKNENTIITPRTILKTLLQLAQRYHIISNRSENISYGKISKIADLIHVPERYGESGLADRKPVQEIFEGKTALSAKHLEFLNYVFCIPSGVILSCSRTASELKKGQYENAKEFGQGLIDLGEAIKNQSQNIANGKQYDEEVVLNALLEAYEQNGFRPIHEKLTPENATHLEQVLGPDRFKKFKQDGTNSK